MDIQRLYHRSLMLQCKVTIKNTVTLNIFATICTEQPRHGAAPMGAKSPVHWSCQYGMVPGVDWRGTGPAPHRYHTMHQ